MRRAGGDVGGDVVVGVDEPVRGGRLVDLVRARARVRARGRDRARAGVRVSVAGVWSTW